jgi:endonuclease/exonuclease/phosphatase family metal-dependent hydrolase
MRIFLTLLLSLLRFTGYFTEPRLSDTEIHAVSGEPARVTRPLGHEGPLRIVTWNIERGVRFNAIAALLRELDGDVVLMQEVDRFCSRSGDRDVARDLAIELGMNWISGGEFQEIGEGSRGRSCVSGQALLSRQPIGDAAVVRFDDQAALKWRFNPAQPRRGGRIALRASTTGLVVYNVHLESGGDEDRRAQQIAQIAKAADAITGPIVVGGDFNNEGPRNSEMFSSLRSAGFINTMNREGAAARRPIDWIFARHLGGSAEPVPAPGASDHDPVVLEMTVQRRF